MKRTILTLVVVAASTLTLSAQPAPKGEKADSKERPSREEMTQKRNAKIAEELGLSESQAIKFSEIIAPPAKEERAEKGEKREKPSKEAMQEARTKMEAAQLAKMKSIAELLDDDQMAKFLVMKSKQQQQKAPQMGRRGGQKGRPMQHRAGKMQHRGRQMGPHSKGPQAKGGKRPAPEKGEKGEKGEKPEGEKPEGEKPAKGKRQAKGEKPEVKE